MVLTFAAQFWHWFRYETDAYRDLIDRLRNMPEERKTAPEYQQILDLLAHLAAARGVWIHRFGAAVAGPGEMFPKGLPLAEVEQRLADMKTAWGTYYQGLAEKEVRREFRYRSSEGEWYDDTVHDVLTQLFGHSIHHRAQIATLMRAMGEEPVVVDYIFWARRIVPGYEDRH